VTYTHGWLNGSLRWLVDMGAMKVGVHPQERAMLDRIDSQAREIAELTATRDANGVWFSGEFVARLQAEVTALRSRLESAERERDQTIIANLRMIEAPDPSPAWAENCSESYDGPSGLFKRAFLTGVRAAVTTIIAAQSQSNQGKANG